MWFSNYFHKGYFIIHLFICGIALTLSSSSLFASQHFLHPFLIPFSFLTIPDSLFENEIKTIDSLKTRPHSVETKHSLIISSIKFELHKSDSLSDKSSTDASSSITQDTTIILGDTLRLLINLDKQDGDSLLFHWFINNKLIDNQNNPSLQYIAVDSIRTADTIKVEIQKSNRLLFTGNWLINISTGLKSLPSFSFSPAQNTIIMQGDSLTCFVVQRIQKSELFSYRWYLNGEVIVNYNDSAYTFIADTSSGLNDTLSVTVYKTISDSVSNWNWYFFIRSNDDTARSPLFKFPQVSASNTPGELIQFKAEPDIQNNDTTAIELYDMNHDSLQNTDRFIHSNRLPQLISYSPTQDTVMTQGDSLLLIVHVRDEEHDSLTFHWTINGELISDNLDSTFLFRADTSTDIITVSFTDTKHDSMLNWTWFITSVSMNKPPHIISILPKQDTTLTHGDSLVFAVQAEDEDGDSLIFQWLINGEIINDHNDSVLSYSADHFSDYADTILVCIRDVVNDTMVNHTWLITKLLQNRLPQLISYSPAQDTLIFQGDSLWLTAHVRDEEHDSLKFNWSINGKFVSDIHDSTFLYTADSASAVTNTITVTFSDAKNDSISSWTWFITTVLNNKPLQIISFFPKQDTTLTYGDSLVFAVKTHDEDGDSLNFQWLVNSKFIIGHNDSLLIYAADSLAEHTDTIAVKISDVNNDTMLTWLVKNIKPSHLFSLSPEEDTLENKELTCPRLIFPINGDLMSEEDYFIWKIDSLDIIEDLLLTYIFQIAEDSLFSKIVTTDTCHVDTIIQFAEISGLENIEINHSYYWRVKARINGKRESRFSKNNHEFTYLPLFVELMDLNAEIDNSGNITLSWSTHYEKRNLGFNVYRSHSKTKDFKKINEGLITGARYYVFIDQNVKPGENYYYKLEEVCTNGITKMHEVISVSALAADNYALYQNYPNPFNVTTSFKYQIPVKINVVIEIFNVLGRKIQTLVNETVEPGFYTAIWDGLDANGTPVVSGIYFYQMSTNSFHATRKMTVIR